MKKINDLQANLVYKNILVSTVLLLASVCLACIFAILFTSGIQVFVTDYMAIIILALCNFGILITMYGYFYYQAASTVKIFKNLSILFTVIVFTVILSAVCMIYLSPYAVPLAISAIIVALLISRTIGFIANLATTLLVLMGVGILDFAVNGGSVFFLEVFFGCSVSILATYSIMFMTNKNYSRFKLIYGSLLVGVVVAFIAMMLSLIISLDWRYFLLAYAYSLVGTVITVGGFSILIPFYEEVFDVWTNFRLAEACSMSRPLLRKLADNAPGTFSHCVVVSNLAESCAIAIGENPNLAKAAGLYHDVGKLMNPEYFVENQDGKYNPHDDLIPKHSSRMIISHGNAGYEIIIKNHLPEEIAIVAKEHHGTTLTAYFYNVAKDITAGKIDETGFRYDGPKPSSKISAIVMICDVVEATTRAKQPDNAEELRRIIDNVIDAKIKDDQFSESEITFADLDEIKVAMTKVIPSIYHKRIDYQKN